FGDGTEPRAATGGGRDVHQREQRDGGDGTGDPAIPELEIVVGADGAPTDAAEVRGAPAPGEGSAPILSAEDFAPPTTPPVPPRPALDPDLFELPGPEVADPRTPAPRPEDFAPPEPAVLEEARARAA